ncbi:MAG: ferric iron reductase, partial [Tumebacillaceae bacterium]
MKDNKKLFGLFITLDMQGLRVPLEFAEGPGRVESVKIARLLTDEQLLHQHIQAVAKRMNSTDLIAAASLFQKRYASVLLGSILTPMSTLGIGLLATAEVTEIVLVDDLPNQLVLKAGHERIVLPARLAARSTVKMEEMVAVESDADLRDRVFHAVFDNNLGPLIYRLASEFGLSPRIMWGNVGNFCGFLYDEELGKREVYREASAKDQEALLLSTGFDAPPLVNTYRNVWLAEAEPAQWIRVRSSCCMWYKFPDKRPCYTCPIVCSSERAEL